MGEPEARARSNSTRDPRYILQQDMQYIYRHLPGILTHGSYGNELPYIYRINERRRSIQPDCWQLLHGDLRRMGNVPENMACSVGAVRAERGAADHSIQVTKTTARCFHFIKPYHQMFIDTVKIESEPSTI